MFKHAIFFRLPKQACEAIAACDLEEALATCPARAPQGLETACAGFGTHPGNALYAWRQGHDVLLRLVEDRRVLPGGALRHTIKLKIEEAEKRLEQRLGKRARKEIADQVRIEALPRALVERSETRILILLDLGLIAVDAGSSKRAESAVQHVRQALGSLPCVPLSCERDPTPIFGLWLQNPSGLPAGWALGQDAQLKHPADGASITLRKQELDSAEVLAHLELGHQVHRLALRHELMEGNLTQDLSLHQIRFPQADEPPEDEAAAYDGSVYLAAQAVRAVFHDLDTVFAVQRAEPLFDAPLEKAA